MCSMCLQNLILASTSDQFAQYSFLWFSFSLHIGLYTNILVLCFACSFLIVLVFFLVPLYYTTRVLNAQQLCLTAVNEDISSTSLLLVSLFLCICLSRTQAKTIPPTSQHCCSTVKIRTAGRLCNGRRRG